MKAGWSRRKISEIATHSLGKMLDKAKNVGDPQPYLRNLNVRWFEFDLTDLLEMRFRPDEYERYTVKKGDLVICEGGYPGRAAIWEHDETIHFQKALHRVRFYEPERAKWCLYYLHFRDAEGTLKQHFNGAGIQHFTGEALARFEIPLPPLPEQRRIVAILDEAFAGLEAMRANAEKNLQNARELSASLSQSIFSGQPSWAEASLDEIVAADCSLSYGIVQPGNEVADGLPIVRPTDLVSRIIELDGLKRIDPSLAASYQRTKLQGGDLLLCVRGTTGTVAIASKSLAGANVSRGIVPVRFDPTRVLADFGYHLLRCEDVQAQVRAKTYGAALMQINIKDLRELRVRVPTLSEQKTISKRLDVADESARELFEIYSEKLAAVDELKQSILQKAFAGELTSSEAVAA